MRNKAWPVASRSPAALGRRMTGSEDRCLCRYRSGEAPVSKRLADALRWFCRDSVACCASSLALGRSHSDSSNYSPAASSGIGQPCKTTLHPGRSLLAWGRSPLKACAVFTRVPCGPPNNNVVNVASVLRYCLLLSGNPHGQLVRHLVSIILQVRSERLTYNQCPPCRDISTLSPPNIENRECANKHAASPEAPHSMQRRVEAANFHLAARIPAAYF